MFWELVTAFVSVHKISFSALPTTSSQPSNIFSPYATEWELDENQMAAALARAEEDGVDTSLPQPKLLLFLYAKGILADKTAVVRKSMFHDLLHGTSDISVAQLNRSKTIVEVGEKSPTRSTLDPKSFFDSFAELHPEWAAGKDVFVAHRDHPKLLSKDHALVERFQKTITIPREFLKKKMSGPNLLAHIWDNRGGDSLDFLVQILSTEPDRNEIIQDVTFVGTDLTTLLKIYGPGLVSGFGVTDDFSSTMAWHHLGRYKGAKFIGRHAMVLIGARKAGESVHYLLQNWWTKKPYVEVDSHFLKSSKAMVHFVTEEQLRMGNFPSSFEELVECESGLDASENPMPEGEL
ncbi:hypothetical protein HDU81_011433 [Chytriomyces hyalinus]|nr:hypothetical protein HDU81_011433 [Chytriomyces hyalinus]